MHTYTVPKSTSKSQAY